MLLTTLGERDGKIMLVSKAKNSDGILPYGSYITVQDNDKKFILRVEDSSQLNSYEISPTVSDMNLKPLLQDQSVKNIIYAVRIKEIPEREDGLYSYIKPLLDGRRSTQDEIDYVIGKNDGVPVFLATTYAYDCQVLKDEDKKPIHINLPEDFFFHQTVIAGATGSGKTAAMKYLAQYFVENLEKYNGPGAVLAINVKEEDLLYMDKPTKTNREEVKKEWESLALQPRGVFAFRIYYPGNKEPNYSPKVERSKCKPITIKTKNLDPDSLIGIVQNLSAIGAEQIVDIFRWWKRDHENRGENITMSDFIAYLNDPKKDRQFNVLNKNGNENFVKLHPGTLQSLINSLTAASKYFDAEGANELSAKDILQRGTMSVIDISQKGALGFGSVFLRDILNKIYEAKTSGDQTNVPILILIDEVHEFYSESRSREALETIDAIARKGRSLGIGVIFSSQNVEDIPSGILKMVNSEIYFKGAKSKTGNKNINEEALRAGFAKVRIHGLSFVNLVKFPLPLGGLYE